MEWKRARRRGWWKGPLLLAGMGALLVAGPRSEPPDSAREASGGVLSARVLEVIDGDTIAVRLQDGSADRVRYIGVDTPESTPDQPLECFGRRSSAANERLVGGQLVRLRFGPERRDAYGRLLAYVFLRPAGGRRLFVNAELVRRGFARTLTISPNDARAPLLRRLERAAGVRGVGLWGVC